MSSEVLALIGQVAAGKTTVARLVARAAGARVATLDEAPTEGGERAAGELAADLARLASRGPLIFECSGTRGVFEELLAALATRGFPPRVVLLAASLETALRRIAERGGAASGEGWLPQLRWVDSRLRLVPADVVVRTDDQGPHQVAAAVLAAWQRPATAVDGPPPSGIFTGVGLAAFEACPLAYRYRYLELRRGTTEPAQRTLERTLGAALSFLYRPGRAPGSVAEGELLEYFRALAAAAGLPAEHVDRGGAMLRTHHREAYRADTLTTLAVERRFALALDGGLTYLGKIDRLARSPAAVLEAIDYDTRGNGSPADDGEGRPWWPDLLPLAAQGVAAMQELEEDRVFLQRASLASAGERVLLRSTDARRIRLALSRWVRRVAGARQHPPRRGEQCATCLFVVPCLEGERSATAGGVPVDLPG